MLRKGLIQLRAIEPTDVDCLYQWENDPESWKVSDANAPLSRYAIEQFVLNSHQDIYTTRQLRWMIDLMQESGGIKTIGCVDLFEFEPRHQRAGVGILIGENSERSKGYSKLALSLLIDYAFNALHLHQVHCLVATTNAPSLALFKGLGFEQIGIKKDWVHDGDSWSDQVALQLLSGKYFKAKDVGEDLLNGGSF